MTSQENTAAAARLLEEIRQKYNHDARELYNAGELDFIPEEVTQTEMLLNVVIDFAKRNYPDLLGEEAPGRSGDIFRAYLNSVHAAITAEKERGEEGASGKLELLEAIKKSYDTIQSGGLYD